MPHISISRLCPRISALLVLAASLAGSCVTAFSAEVGLAWDAKTESDLAGYRIYYGVASRSYGTPIDVGNVTTYAITGLNPDTYYFCVTAYYTSGDETSCSNEVSVTLSPPMYGFRDESVSSVVQLASIHDQHECFREFRIKFSGTRKDRVPRDAQIRLGKGLV